MGEKNLSNSDSERGFVFVVVGLILWGAWASKKSAQRVCEKNQEKSGAEHPKKNPEAYPKKKFQKKIQKRVRKKIQKKSRKIQKSSEKPTKGWEASRKSTNEKNRARSRHRGVAQAFRRSVI